MREIIIHHKSPDLQLQIHVHELRLVFLASTLISPCFAAGLYLPYYAVCAVPYVGSLFASVKVTLRSSILDPEIEETGRSSSLLPTNSAKVGGGRGTASRLLLTTTHIP
jgi:hypothetical protein